MEKGGKIVTKFCSECGTEVTKEDVICHKCGSNLKGIVQTTKSPNVPSSIVEYAGFWKRFAAAIIDMFIIFAQSQKLVVTKIYLTSQHNRYYKINMAKIYLLI